MNTTHDPVGEPEPDQPPRLSVADPALGKSRLLARQCDTCIFRPGNPMHLSPGRLKELVTEAHGGAGYIICHETLPYADSPVPPAICRGFADRYSTQQLQLISRLWGFVDVEPPGHGDPDPASPGRLDTPPVPVRRRDKAQGDARA